MSWIVETLHYWKHNLEFLDYQDSDESFKFNDFSIESTSTSVKRPIVSSLEKVKPVVT